MKWTQELRGDGFLSKVQIIINVGKLEIVDESNGRAKIKKNEVIIINKRLDATDEYLETVAKSLWGDDMLIVGIEAI